MREKLNATVCEWCMIPLKTRNEREDIRSEVGKPERNIACRKFLIKGMSNGSG
jgi:hypothetical protein